MTRYRARLAAHCKIHDRDFIRFSDPNGNHSYGCPDCVAEIKRDTRKVRQTPRRGKARKPKCGSLATGAGRPG